MAADSDETTRTVVKTYLPEYQRDEWDEHADELEMSRSEFVKTMVQAGRRGFEGQPNPEQSTESPPDDGNDAESDPPVPSAATASLEETVLDALSTGDYLSWDELLAAVTDDIETRLEETLQDLQAENRIRYSGREGGYTLES